MQDNEKKIYLLDYINRNENIGQTEKNILFKLYMLDNENGCTASDYYLSKMHNLSPTHINKNLKKLEDKGFIQRSNVYVDNGKHRMIKVNVEKIKETKIENDKTTYQNRQVPIVENDKTTYQNRQVPIVENDNTYTKENTKENTKEKRDSMLAYDFLKEFYLHRLIPWEEKYKHQLKDFDKFIEFFNAQFVIKNELGEIDKEPDELFNFMVRYAKGFIKQEPHFDKLNWGHRGQNTNGH